jgi:hypothetical protein
MRDRLCLYCEHFFVLGTDPYELESKPIVDCNLNMWHMDWDSEERTELRFHLTMANRCEHYKPDPKVLERGY